MNEQIKSMSRTELLQQIRDERRALEKVLSRLTHAQMLVPGVDGDWSIKDVLAHISAWERHMINWIGSHLIGEPPDVPLPWEVDRMNAETFSQVREKPLSEVLEEFRQSYHDSLTLIESLTEKQLQTQYSETWPLGPLWQGVAANTSFHYQEHRVDIEKWIPLRKKEK